MMVSQGLGHRAGPKEHNARSTLTITQGGMLLNVVAYMQKTCDVAEKAILAKKNLRKKCVNRDKM